MKIVSCNINNYKSISEGNILHIEDSVTAVIGKNESGKSNVLEAIGSNSLLKPLSPNYINCVTRNSSNLVSYSVHLEFWDYECEKYGMDNVKTVLEYLDKSSIKLSGGLSLLMENDSELVDLKDKVTEFSKTPSFWGNDINVRTQINDSFKKLNNVFDEIIINPDALFKSVLNRAMKTNEVYESFVAAINRISELISEYYDLLPQIYYRPKEPTLNYLYKYEKFNELLSDRDCLLKNFMLAADLELSDFESAFKSSSDGAKRTAKKKINTNINKNITEKFNEFYTLEKLEIEAEFENNALKIYVITSDKAMTLNERSNGLKWYLNLFIDIQAYKLRDNSVVYLFDEPGIYLHVNAQKELLDLFSNLTEKNNQIIYSTHSPYMINSDNILNVRAIEKNEEGLTKIFRNAYHQDLSEASKNETLSPLVNALGCNLNFNLGPNKDYNLITEGISDYMYIKAMMGYFSVSNSYSIIPSTGVSKIDKLVSILIGWGCNFKVLLDFDKPGYDEYMKLINFHETLSNKIYFVNQDQIPDLNKMKQDPKVIESLISTKDFNKLSNSEDGSYSSKTLSAKEFHDKVKSGKLIPEEETRNNFSVLFKILDIN